jgi:hypothetical protein
MMSSSISGSPKKTICKFAIFVPTIEPGSKVPCRGPFCHVSAYFAEQRQRILLQARNLSHVYPEQFIGFRTQIKLGIRMSVFLSSFAPSPIPFSIGRQRLLLRIDALLKGRQQLFNFQIALHDPLLISSIQLTRLSKRE